MVIAQFTGVSLQNDYLLGAIQRRFVDCFGPSYNETTTRTTSG